MIPWYGNDLPPIQVNFERDQAHTRFSQHNGRENVRMKPNTKTLTSTNDEAKANLESGAIIWYLHLRESTARIIIVRRALYTEGCRNNNIPNTLQHQQINREFVSESCVDHYQVDTKN